MDVEYVRTRNLWKDIVILYKTFDVNKREVYKRCGYLILITGLYFKLSLQCLSIYDTKANKFNSASNYYEEQIVGTFEEKSGSNCARFSIIKSNLRIVWDYPAFGVRSGLKSAYTKDYLLPKEKLVPEVSMWIKLQDDLGVMKSGIPSICEFSKRLAESGWVGLLVYLLPFFIILNMYWKKRNNLFLTNA